MANVQVKNVPVALHQRLRAYAARRRCTIGEVVLDAVERELARAEFRERLATRPPTEDRLFQGTLLEEERRQREKDLSG
jgi:hypothetical protein